MGLKDLEGKRTGRPRGAKTTSRVRRDILWAYRNLDNPDAKPPSPGAKMWAEHARKQPAHFLGCVVRVETAGDQEADSEGEGGLPDGVPNGTGEPSGKGLAGKAPQRLRKLLIGAQHLLGRLTRDGGSKVANLPRDAYVVGCESDSSRDGIYLIIYSATFPPVEEGQAIPELPGEFYW